MTTALFTGFGLGFLVAAQVGPIWLLAARSVILGRFATGIMIGLGAATIDMAYGALGLAGAASLLRITGLRLGLGLLGAAVLTILGARALRNATRAGNQAEPSTAITSAPRAYLTALSGTAANPLTIASWAAIFAAASAAHISRTTTGAVLLLAGIGLGTASWFTALSTAMTLVRRLAGRRIHQAIDVISGLGLIGFGILLAWHTTTAASR
jgi:threonine/homoserine/homoserine lactone efflux protein